MQMSSGLTIRKQEVIDQPVTHFHVYWLSGDIRIFPSKDESIHVVQLAGTRYPERKLLEVSVQGDRLMISDGRKKGLPIGLNLGRTELEVHVPNRLFDALMVSMTGGNLFIDTIQVLRCQCKITSGNAELSGDIKELELHATGSNITGKDLKVERLKVQSTATKVQMSGQFLQVETTNSGRGINLECLTMPESINTVSTGAKTVIAIPDNEGFELLLNQRSGKFKNEFHVTTINGEKGRYVYKNGTKTIRIDIRGGTVHLKAIKGNDHPDT